MNSISTSTHQNKEEEISAAMGKASWKCFLYVQIARGDARISNTLQYAVAISCRANAGLDAMPEC